MIPTCLGKIRTGMCRVWAWSAWPRLLRCASPGASPLRPLLRVARRLRALHLPRRREEGAAPPERLGHAQHQQPQRPHPQEVVPGRGGVCAGLRPARRLPSAAATCHLRQGEDEAAEWARGTGDSGRGWGWGDGFCRGEVPLSDRFPFSSSQGGWGRVVRSTSPLWLCREGLPQLSRGFGTDPLSRAQRIPGNQFLEARWQRDIFSGRWGVTTVCDGRSHHAIGTKPPAPCLRNSGPKQIQLWGARNTCWGSQGLIRVLGIGSLTVCSVTARESADLELWLFS